MNENENKSYVHGYKVFNPDWTCTRNGTHKQYTCPGKFEEDVELELGERGMHFCQTVVDCFNFCSLDRDNKVAEVIAYGEVLTYRNQSCTDKLEIVREIPWDEVLRIINSGKGCTGCGNTGDWDTGDKNTGDWNTGNGNAGEGNTGNKNIGDWNTGDKNTGDWNTGDKNTGNKNTGDCNTGNKNTGDCNTGNKNTGDWNKSSNNTGCFNTVEQKIMMFNKPSDMTYCDWRLSDARRLLDQMSKDAVEWIYEKDMTAEEKEQHPEYETTGGYLKELDESECGQMWWDSLSERERDIIRSIPNFDSDIFKECTGIDVNKQQVIPSNDLSSIKSF